MRYIDAVFTDKRQAELYSAFHGGNVEEWETDKSYFDEGTKLFVVHKIRIHSVTEFEVEKLFGSLRPFSRLDDDPTEENERLNHRCIAKIVIDGEKLEEIKNECLARVELDIKAIQADTVRKIRKSLYEEFLKIARCQVADEPNMRSREVFAILDKTANELLKEGEK